MFLHIVDHPNHDENHHRDNQEVDCSLDELAVGHVGRIGTGAGHADFQTAEIEAASQYTNERRQNVRDQGTDDFTEGTANDDSDRQVHGVAAHDEMFKILEHS